MESERPHRSTSELFICFTSRHSSSMKASSKSSLSPGRSSDKFREPTLSLSSSLSRRLRSNGSMKGGQASPMFPTGSKKKGSSFETPEPSSPKVTCIGQVRVKTKKQGKKFRTRSKRRGEVSFRKTEQLQEGGVFLHSQSQQQQECLPHRNQRWVHLPLSICEALRAFGAEFSCFLPCRSSCLTGEREKTEKRRNRSNATTTSSCGAVFARWLMALQDGEEEKRREVEVSSREEEEKRENRGEVVREMQMQISKEKQVVVCEEIEEEEEEEARVSICVPPRNALLLMRCRSEPFRSSALANRFWESPVPKEEDDNEEDEREYNEDDDNDEEQEAVEVAAAAAVEKEEVKLEAEEDEEEHQEEEMVEIPKMEGNPEVPNKEEEQKEERNTATAEMQQTTEEEEEIMVNESSPEAVNEEEIEESEENPFLQEREELMLLERDERISLEREEKEAAAAKEEMEERRASVSSRRVSVSSCTLSVHPEEEEERVEPEVESFEERVEKSVEEKETEEETEKAQERSATETEEEEQQQTQDLQFLHREELEEESDSDSDSVLPDCLLLMMCEPKLSMEVSKETWVCSTDFIRYRPERKGGGNQKMDSGDESKKRVSTDSNPGLPPPHPAQNKHHHHQPPRRSFSSKPTPPPPVAVAVAVAAPPLAPASASSMATMIEQKLVNAVAYEPFVLTRCKSEPMRSSAKLAPEACFWKNMKLEPHGPTTLGVGATGIGF